MDLLILVELASLKDCVKVILPLTVLLLYNLILDRLARFQHLQPLHNQDGEEESHVLHIKTCKRLINVVRLAWLLYRSCYIFDVLYVSAAHILPTNYRRNGCLSFLFIFF